MKNELPTFDEFLNESNMNGFGEDLLFTVNELQKMIMSKEFGNMTEHKKAQAELKILKEAYNIMWKWEPIMKRK